MRTPDPALWLLVTSTTRSFAQQTAETLVMRDGLLDVAATFRRCQIEHRAGHSFEVLQTWSFNLDAIRKRVDVRAHRVGAANGPADIRIADTGGRVLADVQTKLMDDPLATAGRLRADRYVGMQRVVAGDKVDDVRGYLVKGQRAFNPDGEIHAGYVDAEANLAGRVELGRVHSTPMTRSEVHAIAANPGRWATVRSAQAAGRQVGVAAATGAASGAVVGGGIEFVGQCVRVSAGETTTADAVWSVVVAAGAGAVRSAAVAGLGEVVRIATRQKLAGSALPIAIGSVAADVAGAGIAFARGEVDGTAFALCGVESVLGTVAAGAFAAVGQAVMPVPAVGFVLGGLVGQLAATAVAGWVRSWITEADEPVAEPAAIAAVPAAEHLVAQVDAVIGEVSGWLAGIYADVVTAADEFDAWMTDPGSTLALDPNPA